MTMASTLCEKFSHSKERLAVEGLLCQHSEYFRTDVLQCQLSQLYSTQKALKKRQHIRDHRAASPELEQPKKQFCL